MRCYWACVKKFRVSVCRCRSNSHTYVHIVTLRCAWSKKEFIIGTMRENRQSITHLFRSQHVCSSRNEFENARTNRTRIALFVNVDPFRKKKQKKYYIRERERENANVLPKVRRRLVLSRRYMFVQLCSVSAFRFSLKRAPLHMLSSLSAVAQTVTHKRPRLFHLAGNNFSRTILHHFRAHFTISRRKFSTYLSQQRDCREFF